jgi:hypothetical protein
MKRAALLISLIASFLVTNKVIATDPTRHPEINGLPLSLDKTVGAAPLTVSVNGPQSLAVLLIGTHQVGRHNNFGDGFSIDWGDGTGDGDAVRGIVGAKAAVAGTHVYSAAGTYTVTAQLYDFTKAAEGGRIVYWTGTTTVTVR